MEYIVKKGDSWYKIAKNLGINVNDLLRANDAKLDTMLQPRQKLKTSKVPEQPVTTNRWQVVAGHRLVKKPQAVKTNLTSQNESLQTIKQVGSNFVRNPLQTKVDVALYVADKIGAPTNATNYLRDLNVSIPYRIKNAIHAGYNTIMGDKSFKENYDELLANPGWYTDFSTIRPLTNNNTNFSNEELQVIRDAAGEDFQIDNADIKRVSEDGKYGKNDALTKYFSPSKVFQTAIGQSSGNADNKTITDVFDVNTVGDIAQRDNEMYLKEAKKNLGPNYATMRASMPYLNMIDIMPNKFKIHTKLKFNE